MIVPISADRMGSYSMYPDCGQKQKSTVFVLYLIECKENTEPMQVCATGRVV